MTNEPKFEQKSNWKESLKFKFGGLVSRFRRGKSTDAPVEESQNPDAFVEGAPEFDASPNGSAPEQFQPTDRTLTGMIRAKWDAGLAAFRNSSSRASGGGVLAFGTGFRPTWDEKTLNFYALLAAILLTTWIAADLTSLLVERFIPDAPPSRPSFGDSGYRPSTIADYQVIVTRNLFNSRGLIPGDDADTGNRDNNNVPVRSTLPLNLVGTVVLKNELRSVATIEDKGDQMVYPVRVDDEIPGKVRIIAVEAYRVVFVNLASGRREFIDLPEDPNAGAITLGTRSPAPRGGAPAAGSAIEQLSATQFNLPRDEINKALSNMNEILTQARAIPNLENGMPAGYKLIQIVPGSVYTKLGLQNGDILCGVNGEPINDPGKAFEALGALKTSSHMELCVKRDGKTSNFAYEIK